jgi:hypothetical protein
VWTPFWLECRYPLFTFLLNLFNLSKFMEIELTCIRIGLANFIAGRLNPSFSPNPLVGSIFKRYIYPCFAISAITTLCLCCACFSSPWPLSDHGGSRFCLSVFVSCLPFSGLRLRRGLRLSVLPLLLLLLLLLPLPLLLLLLLLLVRSISTLGDGGGSDDRDE